MLFNTGASSECVTRMSAKSSGTSPTATRGLAIGDSDVRDVVFVPLSLVFCEHKGETVKNSETCMEEVVSQSFSECKFTESLDEGGQGVEDKLD